MYLLERVLKQGFSGHCDLDVLRHRQLLETRKMSGAFYFAEPLVHFKECYQDLKQ